jgi:hypothetical protein
MVIPLAWDEDGASECAFVTRAFYRGKAVDQLKMHIRGGMGFSAGSSSSSKSSLGHSDGLLNMESDGTYRIVTVCFDHECNELAPVGVTPVYDTGCAFPTFGIVKPAVMNNRVDMSPYGQSVFADVVDAMQAVDLTFDALINEVGVRKMRVFLSDVLFDREKNRDKTISIPFGKSDCTVFRKVMSTEDTIQEFAPALRISSQSEAFRIALQMLGDLTGFGIGYFDYDESRGHVRTATKVSSDNSALMRNIRRHENALRSPISDIARAIMCVSRGFDEDIPDEGVMRVMFDDSIIQDVSAEKAQDMAEVGVTMAAWGYRAKWYGEEESVARAWAAEIGTGAIKRDTVTSGLSEAVSATVSHFLVRGSFDWQWASGKATWSPRTCSGGAVEVGSRIGLSRLRDGSWLTLSGAGCRRSGWEAVTAA